MIIFWGGGGAGGGGGRIKHAHKHRTHPPRVKLEFIKKLWCHKHCQRLQEKRGQI